MANKIVTLEALQTLINKIKASLSTKADTEHEHVIDDVTNLQSTLDTKADKTELHSHDNKTVLDGITSAKVTEWNNKSTFSGSYSDLTDKPTIPTKTSHLTNDSNLVNTTTLNSELAEKADTNHDHTTADITDLTATASELNVLDGITATTAELNYVEGVTSAIQTQLNAKAPKASPTFTGTPKVPTATAGTNTTQIATTAFVTTAVANKTSISGNAGTATKLETARNIALSGDVTGSASFDGSGDISITTTVADDSHNHTIANIDNLQATLNAKADATDLHSHDNKTVLDGITSNKVTEWNNKSTFSGSYNDLSDKPTIPSKTSQLTNDSDFATNATVTSGLAGKSDTTHTHDEYENQNAFSTIKSDQNGITVNHNASSPSSTLTIKAGSNITIGGDSTNNIITINGNYLKATTSADGLMSSTDKSKLNGIASGANKTTVDSALSSTSTNPVQNKVINTALAEKASATHEHTLDEISNLELTTMTDVDTIWEEVNA